MANIAGFRSTLYELASVAKEMAEDPNLENVSVDDADFIHEVMIAIENINKKRAS